MTELEQIPKNCAVYRLTERSEQVSTAKSQFADEFDAEYSDLKGKIIEKGGYNDPRLCVVIDLS